MKRSPAGQRIKTAYKTPGRAAWRGHSLRSTYSIADTRKFHPDAASPSAAVSRAWFKPDLITRQVGTLVKRLNGRGEGSSKQTIEIRLRGHSVWLRRRCIWKQTCAELLRVCRPRRQTFTKPTSSIDCLMLSASLSTSWGAGTGLWALDMYNTASNKIVIEFNVVEIYVSLLQVVLAPSKYFPFLKRV